MVFPSTRPELQGVPDSLDEFEVKNNGGTHKPATRKVQLSGTLLGSSLLLLQGAEPNVFPLRPCKAAPLVTPGIEELGGRQLPPRRKEAMSGVRDLQSFRVDYSAVSCPRVFR